METTHPIFSLEEAQDWEKTVLDESTETIANAMAQAGEGVGKQLLADYLEIRPWPSNPQLLVLMGPGYNGGDALIAAETLMKVLPSETMLYIVAVENIKNTKPLVKKNLERIVSLKNVQYIELDERDDKQNAYLKLEHFLKEVVSIDICLDGIYGLNSRLPIPEKVVSLIEYINHSEKILFRAAIDIPSGLKAKKGEPSNAVFRADFSYSTGTLKKILLEKENQQWVGRVRYIDIGFFENIEKVRSLESQEFCILKKCLWNLNQLRPSNSTKRTIGHLVMLAGSRSMPGALIMAARSALKSGIGLLTICTVKNLVPSLATALPEALWLPCEETEEGFLMMDSVVKISKKIAEANAVLIGPGLGRDPQTQQLIRALLPKIECPCVLDADGLFPENLVAWTKGQSIGKSKNRLLTITPHEGEFKRLMKIRKEEEWSQKHIEQFIQYYPNIHLVLKGQITKFIDQHRTIYSEYGGPILARGGSGDVLAGIIAGLLTQKKFMNKEEAMETTLQAIVWSGIAAELLAREQGQKAVCTTQITDYFSKALRES